MKKTKLMATVICVLLLVIGSLWWYWEYPLALNELIPKENWARMEMEQMLPYNMSGNLTFEDPPMEDVLALLPAIRVTRAQNSNYVEDDSFRITLFKGEAWPTVMYISPTGKIQIAAELEFDNWKCYEGGEALYQYLHTCSKTLTALLPVENSSLLIPNS